MKKNEKEVAFQQYENLLKRLDNEQKALEKDLAGIADKNPHIKGDFKARMPLVGKDEDEESIERSLYETNLASEHSLEDRLLLVNKALDKAKNGIYGKCSLCQGKISLERLEAMPEAEHCLACEEKQLA